MGGSDLQWCASKVRCGAAKEEEDSMQSDESAMATVATFHLDSGDGDMPKVLGVGQKGGEGQGRQRGSIGPWTVGGRCTDEQAVVGGEARERQSYSSER